MNARVLKILGLIALITVLAILSSVLPSRFQSQAMSTTIGEQSQVKEEQTPPQNKATATITITMTGVVSDEER
jgi:hypothetical protein